MNSLREKKFSTPTHSFALGAPVSVLLLTYGAFLCVGNFLSVVFPLIFHSLHTHTILFAPEYAKSCV